MNRLLLIAVAAASLSALFYARRARKVPELTRALASKEVELAVMTSERDAYLKAALKRAGAGVLERIAADMAAPPVARPVPKVIHPERTYTLPGLLRVTGLRDCE